MIDELKRSSHDQGLADYAIAQAFSETRAAQTYEERGERMAEDYQDGATSDIVRRFRNKLLELRKEPDLAEVLYKRMNEVYARVLPGFEPGVSKAPGAVYFVVGPEKQLDLYEAYLKLAVSPDAKLFRLYPRDFWLTRGVQ